MGKHILIRRGSIGESNGCLIFFPFIPGLMNPGYDVLVHGVNCQNENMTNTLETGLEISQPTLSLYFIPILAPLFGLLSP